MKRTLHLSFVAISMAAWLISNTMAAPYQVADIGPYGQGPLVKGMNNSGTVVGCMSGISQSFAWSVSTGLVYLSPLSGDTKSYAYGINDSGQVAGASTSAYPSPTYACLWEEGKPALDLGALPSCQYSPSSAAIGINNSGQVVGPSTSSTGHSHAFLWSSSTGMEDLNGADDANGTNASAISDDGTVVGRNGLNGFIWTRAAGMRDISVPGLYISAVDINNAGLVVLQAIEPALSGPAYLWQEGHDLIDLGALPGPSPHGIEARDINNLGQVVGDSNQKAFVWDFTNGIQALPLPSGFSQSSAGAINDRGLIAGTARGADGMWHLLLWTPIPEPSSLAAILAGLVGFGAVLRRRRAR